MDGPKGYTKTSDHPHSPLPTQRKCPHTPTHLQYTSTHPHPTIINVHWPPLTKNIPPPIPTQKCPVTPTHPKYISSHLHLPPPYPPTPQKMPKKIYLRFLNLKISLFLKFIDSNFFEWKNGNGSPHLVLFEVIWSTSRYERSLKNNSVSGKYLKILYQIFNKFSSIKIPVLIPKHDFKVF